MEIRVEKIRNKGFTLIELLVVLAIGSIVLLGALSFFERQQAVFNQQSEQAEKQANLRVAMYNLSRDIALAGYTGTPFGVEQAIEQAQTLGVSIPIRAIIPIDVQSDPELSGYVLYNQQNIPLDAIEIWANFSPDGERRHLSANVNSGMSVVYANTVDIFVNTVWDEDSGTNINAFPTGIVVGSLQERADYLPLTSVDASTGALSSSESLLHSYIANLDEVAPVLRRRYFVQEICEGARCERWLIRRDYYVGKTVDQRLAQGVDDFQIFYDMTQPGTGVFGVEIDPDDIGGESAVDPCWITAVTVRLQARVVTRDMPKPLVTSLTRKIKVENIGIYPSLNNCPLP